MYKVVALIVRNPELSPEEFREYWEKVHVPLVKACMPGLVKYTGGFKADVPGVVDTSIELQGYDLMVELGFADRESMQRAMASAAFQSEERSRSSARLMDLPKCRSFVVEEIDVLA